MPMLEVRGLHKSFGGVVANSDVTFDVHRGMILGLIGPNGAGKTTLFNCITGHEPPSRGDVIFNGTRVNGRRPDEICRLGMARTWQKVRPLAKMTVLDNVMVGALLRTRSLGTAKALAMQELESVSLAHRASVHAGGLPIGERKRLEVARLLATQPKLVLFDEVMGGLTPTESDEMVELIFALKRRGLTQVIIEHDMKAIMRLSDWVVVLRSGEKLAEGTPSQIVSNPDVISAYLGDEIDA
ncbi:MAG TPA: ABC transporter ATP-binding protein [Polyangiaceae bacterium]